LIQHTGFSLLKKTTASFDVKMQKQIEDVQKIILPKSVVEINKATEAPITVTLSMIIAESNPDLYKVLLYRFFISEPDDTDIFKLYEYALSSNEVLMAAVINNSSARQLEIVYDGMVLMQLELLSADSAASDQESAWQKAMDLGRRIYDEITYRIERGMSDPARASDAHKITELWRNRFNAFHEAEQRMHATTIEVALKRLRGCDA
jgi:hypothetical protein